MAQFGARGGEQGTPARRQRPTPFGPAFPEVMGAAQADAPWAYRRLFEWLGAPVAGYLRSLGAGDPEGLANDVFLRAFAKLDTFEGTEERFRSWIFAIAHNLAIDDRRRRARQPPQTPWLGEDRASSATTESEALARLGAQRVQVLLAWLSPDQRDVLLLRIVADLTVDQVADVLGKAPGAVKQLQRRGLAALRRQLGDADGTERSSLSAHTPSASPIVHPDR